MRSIINISLPQELSKKVDSLVKKGRYSTKSEFVRDLIRDRMEYEDLVGSVKKSQAEYKAGKFKVLRSLADLDK